jgi:hypothetical protein
MKCEHGHAPLMRENYLMNITIQYKMELSRLCSYATSTLCEEGVGQIGY